MDNVRHGGSISKNWCITGLGSSAKAEKNALPCGANGENDKQNPAVDPQNSMRFLKPARQFRKEAGARFRAEMGFLQLQRLKTGARRGLVAARPLQR